MNYLPLILENPEGYKFKGIIKRLISERMALTKLLGRIFFILKIIPIIITFFTKIIQRIAFPIIVARIYFLTIPSSFPLKKSEGDS